MSRYKFICEECSEPTWLSARERTRASGMKCSSCGCRWLVPSKRSMAKDNIPAFNDIKRKFDEELEDKRKGLDPE